MDVNYAGVPTQGSPFTCRVYDSQKIKVGEIQHGQVGQAVHFVGEFMKHGDWIFFLNSKHFLKWTLAKPALVIWKWQ